MTTGRLLLLDSASLYFRAFYGVPDSFKAPDGTVVNALRGLLDFVSTLVDQHRPDAVVACWDDDWRPQWRVDLLPSYKTHRVAQAGEGGLGEASSDGAGGTGAAEESPERVSSADVVDAAWIRAKYGVEPQQYADFATMRGDTSDGIPGVPGIGEKTAALLLDAYGDLDGILTAAHDPDSAVKPRVRASLVENEELVGVMRQVVRVRDDVCGTEVVRALAPLAPEQRDALEAFGTTWGLGGVVERLTAALSR